MTLSVSMYPRTGTCSGRQYILRCKHLAPHLVGNFTCRYLIGQVLADSHNHLEVTKRIVVPQVSCDRHMFRQTIHEITVLDSSDERTDLLYKILVEPFAALPDVESEGI